VKGAIPSHLALVKSLGGLVETTCEPVVHERRLQDLVGEGGCRVCGSIEIFACVCAMT
jgi:hypothetical protein